MSLQTFRSMNIVASLRFIAGMRCCVDQKLPSHTVPHKRYFRRNIQVVLEYKVIFGASQFFLYIAPLVRTHGQLFVVFAQGCMPDWQP